MINLTTLPNGLRIITDTVKTVDSVAVGIWAGAGARDEEISKPGIAHLTEHMVFKGTKKRSARQIVESVEDAGGDINAYTGREVTAYFIHLLKEDVEMAVDILADIIQHSTFAEDELERERDVVLQEISMVNDNPEELTFDLFFETAYPGQTAGTPILGTDESIRSASREDIITYTQNVYTPQNLIISAAGNIEHEDLVRLCEKLFAFLPGDKDKTRHTALYTGGELRKPKEWEQSHLIFGFSGVPRTAEKYHAAQAFAFILGGGMSSRLFQELREKRGLVYSIEAFHTSLSDSGLFGIYTGTTPDNLQELVPALTGEIENVLSGITDAELARAKKQMRTSLLMNREKMMHRVNYQAKNLIYFGSAPDIDEDQKKIESLNREEIMNFGQSLRQSPLTLTALGPVSGLPDYDDIAGRLAE